MNGEPFQVCQIRKKKEAVDVESVDSVDTYRSLVGGQKPLFAPLAAKHDESMFVVKGMYQLGGGASEGWTPQNCLREPDLYGSIHCRSAKNQSFPIKVLPSPSDP